MSLQHDLEDLKAQHAALEARLADEDRRPRPDSELVNKLKSSKLRVKEKMVVLRSAMHPA